jgi:hypothetical protein
VVATHTNFGARSTVPKKVQICSNDVSERAAGTISGPLTPSNVTGPTAREIVGNQLPNSPLVSLAKGQMFGAPHDSPEGPSDTRMRGSPKEKDWPRMEGYRLDGTLRPTGRVSAPLRSMLWPESGMGTESP